MVSIQNCVTVDSPITVGLNQTSTYSLPYSWTWWLGLSKSLYHNACLFLGAIVLVGELIKEINRKLGMWKRALEVGLLGKLRLMISSH